MITVTTRAIDHVRPELLMRRLSAGVYRFDEHGELEKRCTTCREYWPADNEFFFTGRYPDRLHCYCIACYTARRWPSGRAARSLNH